MQNYIIKLKKRGSRNQCKFDIVVMKQTSSPCNSAIAKIGLYEYYLNNNYSFIRYNKNLLNYCLSKKIQIHYNVLKLLKVLK